VAADAAGTQLGEVLDMQVSTMPVVYPMIQSAPQPRVGVGSGSSSGGTDPGVTGPDAPVRYLSSATVAITWAIATVSRVDAAKRQRQFEPRKEMRSSPARP
jgi:hypothetical protein